MTEPLHMTPEEKTLLDAVLFPHSSPVSVNAALGAVLAQRINPALRERLVMARLASIRAAAEQEIVWDVVGSLGINGDNRVTPLWNAIEAEAQRRFDEENK